MMKKIVIVRLVRLCSTDAVRGKAPETVCVEVWRASTVTDLCVGPAAPLPGRATRNEDRVLVWSLDSHYFDSRRRGPSTISNQDHQLLVMVDTEPPTLHISLTILR